MFTGYQFFDDVKRLWKLLVGGNFFTRYSRSEQQHRSIFQPSNLQSGPTFYSVSQEFKSITWFLFYRVHFSLWTWWKFSRRHHHTNKDFVVWNMQYYFRNDKSLQWRLNIWQSVAPGSSWNKRKISRLLSTHWCCEKIGSIIIIIPSKSSLFYRNLWIYSTKLSYNKTVNICTAAPLPTAAQGSR